MSQHAPTLLLFLLVIGNNVVARAEESHGIIFNFERKILTAESFESLKFVVPYPKFNRSVDEELVRITAAMDLLWKVPSFGCALSNMEKNESQFNVEWILQKVKGEYRAATEDLRRLTAELDSLLAPVYPRANPGRSKRLAIVAPFLAGAATGIFGLGLTAADDVSCFIKGIFGQCIPLPDRNKAAIKATIEAMEEQATEWSRVVNLTNEKFFVVAKDISNLRQMQQQLYAAQSANYAEMLAQHKVLVANVNKMKTCEQHLFVRSQVNHHLNSLVGVLLSIQDSVKAYRLALFTFRTSIYSSLSQISHGFIPMSLLPKEHLIQTLQEAVRLKTQAGSRLSLAIPLQDLSVYYETPLLRSASSSSIGLHLTVEIPFASSATVMNVYEAIALPMHHNDQPGSATVWKFEADYLAVSEDLYATALLSKEDLSRCLGSRSYSVCSTGFALDRQHHSCLATLMLKDSLAAMKVCSIGQYQLPINPSAKNLGFGRWLLTSAHSDYSLSEKTTDSSRPVITNQHKGCYVCIIVLPCNSELVSSQLHIRSDLDSCASTKPTRLEITLPDPLKFLFGQLPPTIEELPNADSMGMAKVELVQSVQKTLMSLPEAMQRDYDEIEKIARPIVTNMTRIRPKIQEEMDSYATWRTTLILGFTLFVVSCILQLVIKPAKTSLQQLGFHKQVIKPKTIVALDEDDFDYVMTQPRHPLRKGTLIIRTRNVQRLLEECSEICETRVYPQLHHITENLQHGTVSNKDMEEELITNTHHPTAPTHTSNCV